MKCKVSIGIIFFFAVVLFSACKEKDCHKDGSCAEDYRRLRLSDEAKSYLWADTGSWWIYKNTRTGELDTQTVTYFNFDSAISKGHYDYSRHITLEYDVLVREVYSTYNQWLYKDKTPGFDADGTPIQTEPFFVQRYVSGEGIILAFYNPFNQGGSPYCQYLGLDSTVTLRGKTYKNVVRFELEMDDIWYPNWDPVPYKYPKAVYYWAKDVGLISRYNVTEKFSWELIDYHIEK